jgi:predicted patatin/cPLA2 family phospholipase
VNRPYIFRGKPYFDGGISDPIPIKKAMELGCDKLIVILTRPKKAFRKPRADARVSRIVSFRFPYAADAIKVTSASIASKVSLLILQKIF